MIYYLLIRPALRRTFHRVAISAPHGEDWGKGPTLFYANHVSWWDGYVACCLCYERWHVDGYLMVEERQLQRYRFFQRTGCFSVDRDDPREAFRSVAYAAHLLKDRPRCGLWIFPQGEITPNDRRPLSTYPGVVHIARRGGPVRCVPVALRFEFLGEQRPEALVRLGASHVVDGSDTRGLHGEMDRRLLAEVEGLRSDTLDGATTAYQTVLSGRRSVNVVWDDVRGKAGR
jgi:chlorobactene lauroyltransferase